MCYLSMGEKKCLLLPHYRANLQVSFMLLTGLDCGVFYRAIPLLFTNDYIILYAKFLCLFGRTLNQADSTTLSRPLVLVHCELHY